MNLCCLLTELKIPQFLRGYIGHRVTYRHEFFLQSVDTFMSFYVLETFPTTFAGMRSFVP